MKSGHDDDGGGVDFFGDFEVVEFAGGVEFAHADERDVHQGDRLVAAAELFPDILIGLPGAGDGAGGVVEGDVVDFCEKRGVAAVVGPVGVEHLELGDAGVAFFLVAEVGLAEGDVLGGHGEAVFGADGGGVGGGEAGENADVGGGGGVRRSQTAATGTSWESTALMT